MADTSDPTFTTKDLDHWIEFMRARNKPVNKDTWSLFIDFIRTVDHSKGDLEGYDEDGAWPSVIDDFCEERRKRNKDSVGGGMDTT